MKRKSGLIWLWLSVVVIAIDQITKLIALRELDYLERIPVIPGWFDWILTYNTGAAFSFLADAGGWQKYLFAGLAMVVSAVLVVWMKKLPRHDWRQAVPFALVIGGALGNVIDRIRIGKVVDFILWYRGDWSWPAFNVADSAICLAAGWLIVLALSEAMQGNKQNEEVQQ